MDIISIIAIGISAIATVVIAACAVINYKMYLNIQEKNEEYRERTQDLYQAIVVATLLSGPSSYGSFEDCKEFFKKHYSGKTKIF